MMNLSYKEVILIPSFKDRYEYLRLGGKVGESTFGFDRYLNQLLYHDPEWKSFRRKIIMRDNGRDMAHPDFEIGGRIIVHHINPLTQEEVVDRNPIIFDPDNVICVSHYTHEAIHYGDSELLPKEPIERKPGDTCLWPRRTS